MKIASTWRRGAALGLALLLCAGAASAQMYKWVDANGKTHFTDTPPPANAKSAPSKLSGAAVGTTSSDMPYALATAMRNFPVTLYTTTACGGCDAGRAYLKSRGIPFTEKTVTNAADEARLKAAGGDGNLPLFVVGSSKLTGYQQGAWDSMLNVALYPAKKILPSTYQYPAAVAAAPAAPKAEPTREVAKQNEAEQAEAEARKKAFAPQTAPPGFRF
jgi:glutaredoxin